ncbi:MAG: hypothetical protein KJO74_03545 [Winogradskyella sp.]|nr:hypothetical protein [Winogradskyella sp.]
MVRILPGGECQSGLEEGIKLFFDEHIKPLQVIKVIEPPIYNTMPMEIYYL